VNLDAINALRRMSDGNSNQLPVLAWDFSIFSRHYAIQRRPCLKLGRREPFHIAEQFQIVFIVIMISQ
jgi:hypothetical protein